MPHTKVEKRRPKLRSGIAKASPSVRQLILSIYGIGECMTAMEVIPLTPDARCARKYKQICGSALI
jgi:hypothetical protein